MAFMTACIMLTNLRYPAPDDAAPSH